MTQTTVRRPFSWKRIVLVLILLLFAALIGFITVANFVFYGSPPAELPCRDCTGDARAVHLDGFDLYYREMGADSSRPPVVLLHGGPGHSSLSFKNGFDFLAAENRVIRYDQRGSGNSQIIADHAAYTVDQLVEELEAIRRDVLQAEQIVVVGHSAGGALAQRYALKYPDRVAGLVLVSSIPVNNGVTAPILWDRLLPALFVMGGWPPADPLARDQMVAEVNEAGLIARLHDPANADLVRDSGYFSFATWREVSRSLSGPDHAADLQQLQVPALVIYGASDSNATGEPTASRLCELLPDCTLARFDQSGHWPFLEEPDKFAQTLNEFLAR